MGIMDFTAAPQTTTSNKRTASSDRPQAKVWLNVGYDAVVTGENGERKTVFVNLPTGIPLDTMEPLPITGQNKEFGQLRAAQNELLKKLQEAADGLEAGAEVDIRLTLRMRKRNEVMEIKSDENPLSIDISSLIG